MGLSSADLAGMRAALNTLMPNTCNILSLTQTADGQGGFTDTWGTATASVACRFETMRQSGREAMAAGALQPFQSWVLTVPSGTTITTANRVQISGTSYNVKGVDNGKTWTGQLRCQLEAL